MMIALFVIVFSLSLASSVFGLADDDIERIQKAYEGIKDIRGNFAQKSYIKDLRRTDAYRGEFFIRASKMRWEYKGERPQAIYINGEQIVVYQKKEQQAFRGAFDKTTYGQAPLALLAGLGNIRKDFDISGKEGRLILRPKHPMGNVTRVELSVSDATFPIDSLTVIDTHSNRIDIHLRNVIINTGFGDAVFEFIPPQGVTVIQR